MAKCQYCGDVIVPEEFEDPQDAQLGYCAYCQNAGLAIDTPEEDESDDDLDDEDFDEETLEDVLKEEDLYDDEEDFEDEDDDDKF